MIYTRVFKVSVPKYQSIPLPHGNHGGKCRQKGRIWGQILDEIPAFIGENTIL